MAKMTGDRQKAVSSLIEAMELAADQDLLIYFLYDLNYTTDLLEEVYKIQIAGNTGIPDIFIQKLKQAIENKKRHLKAHTELELSSRELATLKLIAEDLANQEIADRLFISINTVKTHLKNIYLKLKVDSRAGAVTKAKEMGLL